MKCLKKAKIHLPIFSLTGKMFMGAEVVRLGMFEDKQSVGV